MINEERDALTFGRLELNIGLLIGETTLIFF